MLNNQFEYWTQGEEAVQSWVEDVLDLGFKVKNHNFGIGLNPGGADGAILLYTND